MTLLSMKKISILLLLLSFISCEDTINSLLDDREYITISGTIVDDDSRKPVQGASIEMIGPEDSDSDETGEDGKYSVSVLKKTETEPYESKGTVIFFVSKDGYEGYADAFQADSVPATINVRLREE
ncbi:MAG: hypothetical protein KA015_05005 [Spirochaetes bacterium]|nr:hypothetical protein [Spirochaetota bacterium]